MLKRFQYIKGVSTFKQFVSKKNDTNFEKNTIIYANNGYGKSTLANILKSANQNSPKRIIARKSLINDKNPVEQRIVLKFGNESLVFENGNWVASPKKFTPNILVFDQKYVYENLFVEKVEASHKSNIHNIIIGEEGVSISQKLTEIKEEEKNLKQIFEADKKQLDKKIKLTGRSDYLDINLLEEIEIIEEKEKIDRNVIIYQERNRLLQKSRFPILPLIKWDYSQVSINLVLTIESIHEEAKQKINNHISNHMRKKEAAYDFLHDALDQLLNVCPFCGQSIEKSKDLIEAYQKYFDNTYRKSITDINELIKTWSHWDPSAEILNLENDYDDICYQLQDIVAFLSLENLGDVEIIDFKIFQQYALKIKEKIIQSLQKKASNLNQLIDTDFLKEFQNEIDTINKKIVSINETTNKAEKTALEKIGSIDESIIKELENEQQRLIELMKRFSKEEIEWCKNYKNLGDEYSKIKTKCEVLSEELSQYSEEIFRKYQVEMNEILEELGVDFKIINLSEQVDNRAKQPFADFQLEINNNPVSTKALGDSPCFQNTLSSGEKNTLSFAFFVASLHHMENLNESIVVFDDPLSSMDDNRRLITANIINNLAGQTNQVIVLTHKKDFLQLLYERFPECKVLSIKKDAAKGSRIMPFDIKNEFKSNQQKKVEKLYRYLDEDFCQVEEVQSDIRICLENALKFKYFYYFQGKKNNKSTLGEIIYELERKNKISAALMNKLKELNEFSKPVHHGSLNHDPMKNLTRTEALVYVKKAIKVLEMI